MFGCRSLFLEFSLKELFIPKSKIWKIILKILLASLLSEISLTFCYLFPKYLAEMMISMSFISNDSNYVNAFADFYLCLLFFKCDIFLLFIVFRN